MSHACRCLSVLAWVLILGLCTLSSPSPAAPNPSGPRLGLQTWTLRYSTFEQVVEFATANGIQYVQFTKDHLDPNAPAEETLRKKAVLDRAGLVPYAFGVVETTSDEAANRKLFDFARRIGAELMVVEPKLADWSGLEALVKEYDLKLAIHNHGIGTTYGDPQVVREILSRLDPRIGVCLDVGWITAAGFDAAKVFREYQGRVFDIHFKDKKLAAPGGLASSDTLIGAGSTNYPGLFTEIRTAGWSGVMAIETDSDDLARNPQRFVTAAKTVFAHSDQQMSR
jgi:sugar phosphate isomerase/epimerase